MSPVTVITGIQGILFAQTRIQSIFVVIFRSDFIYDIVEHMKPSAPAAGTKKSSRKRPTVSSQFKVSLHFLIFFCYLLVLHDLLDIVDFVPFHHCPSLLRVGLLIPVTRILEKKLSLLSVKQWSILVLYSAGLNQGIVDKPP